MEALLPREEEGEGDNEPDVEEQAEVEEEPEASEEVTKTLPSWAKPKEKSSHHRNERFDPFRFKGINLLVVGFLTNLAVQSVTSTSSLWLSFPSQLTILSE